MKCIVPLLFVIAVCAAGVAKNPTPVFKDGNDHFFEERFDTDGEVDQDFIDNYKDTDNSFHLFTRRNSHQSQELFIGDAEALRNSNFDANKITVFFSHGWISNGFDSDARQITNAFTETQDVNLIQFDWSRMARRNYVTAKFGVPKVGRGLCAFIMFLWTQGVQSHRIHLVGFSLGGHLVGNAGRCLHGHIQRITALDPAGPLWLFDRDRLHVADARYVEVIHTNTDWLGFSDPLGDADFYPNGGGSMPGCLTNTCSHGRAVEFMASSVRYNRFNARQCESMRDMRRDRCEGAHNLMGNNDLGKWRHGVFRVNTDRRYPFY